MGCDSWHNSNDAGKILRVSVTTIKDAEFLLIPAVQQLLALLNSEGEEARVAGGAVRNTLLSQPVKDVDIATTALPSEVMRRCEAAGIRAVPTGIDHGTITAIVDGVPYEITTLREDIETDGRHATVKFGRDWAHDANRRDFTINGLYALADGTVIDLVGGIADINTKTLRFIGDAGQRIGEDHLRILRFFRFFAWYGQGRPDADGIRASARLKDNLQQLSAERVWAELKKILSAPDPSRALLWMRQAGVLTAILPESEKWGIDAVHGLIKVEAEFGWPVDVMLRLESIVPPYDAKMQDLAQRLRLSKAESNRLVAWANAKASAPMTTDKVLALDLYHGDAAAIVDRLKLGIATAFEKADKKALAGLNRQLEFASQWQPPVFPLAGADMLASGLESGPEVGKRLKQLEEKWVASGFKLTKAQLLDG
jgi:poly(A) polymerase